MNVEITFRMETKNLPNDIDRDDECWIVECREKGNDLVVGWATVKIRPNCDRRLVDYIKDEKRFRMKRLATRLVEAIRAEWPNVMVSDGFPDDGREFVNSLPPAIVLRLP